MYGLIKDLRKLSTKLLSKTYGKELRAQDSVKLLGIWNRACHRTDAQTL